MALVRLLEVETLHKSTLTYCRPESERGSSFGGPFRRNTLVILPIVDLLKPRLQLSMTEPGLSFQILPNWLKKFDKVYKAGFRRRADRLLSETTSPLCKNEAYNPFTCSDFTEAKTAGGFPPISGNSVAQWTKISTSSITSLCQHFKLALLFFVGPTRIPLELAEQLDSECVCVLIELERQPSQPEVLG